MREIASSLVHSATGDWVPQRALDAGCGTGHNLNWMDGSLAAKSVMGIDIAFHGLAIGASRAAGPMMQSSVFSMPFASESFDFLLCEDVLQHLPVDKGDVDALKEMCRVLQKGGWLLIRANSRLGMGAKASSKDYDYQRYTLDDVVERVEQAGFVVRRATYANCLPSLYAILRDRVMPALKGSAGAHQHHDHHHDHQDGEDKVYGGHQTRDTAAQTPRLNGVLRSVLSMEATLISKFKVTIPFGHTTFCLAQRPN